MNIKLESSRLELVLLDTSYSLLLYDFLARNAGFFKKWSPGYDVNYFTEEYHRKTLERLERETSEGRTIKFGVFIKNDPERIIGTVVFSNIIYGPFLSCFLGYRTDEKENGKGYTTEAVKTGLDYVFDVLKLHRVEANIIPYNNASIRVVEKLGFKLEGCSQNYLKINGKWADHLHYVKFNDTI